LAIDKQTNRWSGPLHQATLAVANGGLKICAAVLFNSNTVMFLQLCSAVGFLQAAEEEVENDLLILSASAAEETAVRNLYCITFFLLQLTGK